MSDERRLIQVACSVSLVVAHEVEVEVRWPPDEEDLYQAEVSAIGEIHRRYPNRTDLEVGTTMPRVPVVQRADEPPESAWIEWGASEWATDGRMVIRRDCPRPPRRAGFQWTANPVKLPSVLDEVKGLQATAMRLRADREPDAAFVVAERWRAVVAELGTTAAMWWADRWFTVFRDGDNVPFAILSAPLRNLIPPGAAF